MSYRKALALVLLLLVGLVYPVCLLAQRTMPLQTTPHKRSPIRAFEGDVLVFNHDSPVEGKLEWSIGGRHFCTGSTCEVDTSLLRSGSHRLVLRQLKDAVEQRSEVSIQVLPRPSIDRMGASRVQVPLRLLKELNPIAVTWQCELVTGIGFYRHPQGLRQVVEDAIPMEWSGSLETGVSSVVRFGKPKALEGYLLPNSVLFFTTGLKGTLGLELPRGLIRLRNHSSSVPPRLSLGETGIDIQGDAESDLIVEYRPGSKPAVQVTALRGTARVSGIKEPIVVPTGGQGVWQVGSDAVAITRPKALRWRAVILATTPELARLEQAKVSQRRWGRLNDVPLSEEEWDGMLAAGDALRVVEGIALLAENQRNDPRVALVEGEALARVFLLDEALSSFSKREKQMPKEKIPEAFYGAWGLALLWEEKWQAAEERFLKAERVAKTSPSTWRYYRAVAAQRQDKNLAAHRAFTAVIWDQESPSEIRASASQFVSHLENQSLHRGAFAIGVLRDSNVLHHGREKALGRAFTYSGHYRYSLFKDKEGQAAAAIALDGTSYDKREFVPAGRVHVEGDFALELAIPSADAMKPRHHFMSGLRLGTMIFMEARAYDYIALRAEFLSWLPIVSMPLRIEAEHMLGLDPRNGDTFPYDPLFHGKIGPANHSFAAHSLRLIGTQQFGRDIEGSMSASLRKRWFYQGGDQNGMFDSMTLGLEMTWTYRLRPWLPLNAKIQLDSEHFSRWPTSRKDTYFVGEGGAQWWWNAQWYLEGTVTYESRQSPASLEGQAAAFTRTAAGLRAGFSF